MRKKIKFELIFSRYFRLEELHLICRGNRLIINQMKALNVFLLYIFNELKVQFIK